MGETESKRTVFPISYLNHPSFQPLLKHAEEEFVFHHPQVVKQILAKRMSFLISLLDWKFLKDEGKENSPSFGIFPPVFLSRL